MGNWLNYKGILVPAADPTDTEGLNLKNDLIALADRAGPSTLAPLAAAATAAALPSNTYNNGSSGVGATLTATANGQLTVDSYAVNSSDVILVKNEGTAANNGLYVVTAPGDSTGGGHPYVLTRHSSMNSPGEFSGVGVSVGTAGATNDNTLWLCTTSNPVTVGTTPINFVQITASIQAGTGISVSGNTVSLSIPVSVADGGTGATSLAGGKILIGNGTGAVATGNATVGGTLTLGGALTAAGNNIAASESSTQQIGSHTYTTFNGLKIDLQSGGGPHITLDASSGNCALGAVTAGIWNANTITVPFGGTGATTLTGIVKGNGTSAFTAVTAPSGNLVGDSATQTLTNKTIAYASNTLTGVQPATTLYRLSDFDLTYDTTGSFTGLTFTATGPGCFVPTMQFLQTTPLLFRLPPIASMLGTLTAPQWNGTNPIVDDGGGGSLRDGTYYYYLTATDGTGETSQSQEQSVSVSSGNANKITLNWNVVSGATGYKIYRGTNQSGSERLLTTIGSGATVTYNDTGSVRNQSASSAPSLSIAGTTSTGGTLLANVYYYYQVSAVLSDGETLLSSEQSQQADASGTGTVSLSWSAVGGATGYKIYRSTYSGLERIYHSVGATTSYTDIGGSFDPTMAPPFTSTTAGSLVVKPFVLTDPLGFVGNYGIYLFPSLSNPLATIASAYNITSPYTVSGSGGSITVGTDGENYTIISSKLW